MTMQEISIRLAWEVAEILEHDTATIIRSVATPEERVALWSMLCLAARGLENRFSESDPTPTEDLLCGFLDAATEAYRTLTGKTWGSGSVSATAGADQRI
jgi:hypothetical protein